MVELRKITKENFRKIVDMKLPPEQDFVAPNVVSLAQAWLAYEEARPLAVYNDDTLVGFMMLDYDYPCREAGVWRFMIAPEHQNKGYGRAAMIAAIDMIKADGGFDSINLDYVPGNDVAKHLYESLGFHETGEIEEGEIVMEMRLK